MQAEKGEKANSFLVTSINELETPFECNPNRKMHLHNITTGSPATEEMVEDILNAKSRDEESLAKYLKERLKEESVSF